MGQQRRTWTCGVCLGLLVLGCGGATGTVPPHTPPAQQTPAQPPLQPPPPEQPKPEPLHCPGDAAVAPEPGTADPGACRETLLEGDGRTRTRTERRFDAAGRLLSRETFGPDGQLATFERRSYDTAGRLLSRETPSGRSTWSLDPCGRPLRLEEQEGEGGTLLATFTYDPEGRPQDTTRRYAGSSREARTEQVSYAYDAQGRLQREALHTQRGDAVVRQLDEYQYDAGGRVTLHQTTREGAGYAAPQVSWTRSEYDAQGRLVLTLSHRREGPVQRTERLYDAAGRLRVVERTEGRSGEPGATSGTRERRAYDAQGRPTEVVTETFGADRVVQETRWSCTWSEDGSRTERFRARDRSVERWEHAYDARGLLVHWRSENDDAAVASHGTHLYGAGEELRRSETRRHTAGHTWSYVEVHDYDAAGRRRLTDAQSIAKGASGVTYSHTERLMDYDAAGRLTLQEDWDLAGSARVLLLRLQRAFACEP